MSFIPKSPLNIPEVNATPPLPIPGTRGIFAKKDGWYDIDSNGVIRKLGEGGSSPGEDTPVFEEIQALIFENGLRIESREEGIYLVDTNLGEDENREVLLYSGGTASQVENAQYATYASDAGYASEAEYAVFADSDGDGNNIVKTYATKAEAGDSNKQAIKFTNGYSIKVIDNKLYLTDDKGSEVLFYAGGFDSYATKVEHANSAGSAENADHAIQAEVDINDRPLKGNETIDEGDYEDLTHYILDGYEISYGVITNSIDAFISHPSEVTVGFISGLHFTTPSEMPEDYSKFPDTIYFKGDDVVDGRFIPEANTRYSIVFFCDGNLLVGCVLGVPAPPVEPEEEVIE